MLTSLADVRCIIVEQTVHLGRRVHWRPLQVLCARSSRAAEVVEESGRQQGVRGAEHGAASVRSSVTKASARTTSRNLSSFSMHASVSIWLTKPFSNVLRKAALALR